ncbi:MAG: MBG domain-containing protein, partial [Fimbriimonadaceae bacterium]|nr:MBG domain-containing protein [Fimbriimonadaceae bacterium]
MVILRCSAEGAAPTNIALSQLAVNQSVATSGALVGTLSTTDPDPGDSHTYALVGGADSTHNTRFAIVGNALNVGASALAPGNYSIRVRSTDSTAASFEKAFAINVVDNVAPSVTGVVVPAAGTYPVGANLDFTVFFSEPVSVMGGAPRIPLTLDTGGAVFLTYVSGTGTVALTFRYTVQAGNADANGVALGAAIDPNGAAIVDVVGNSASPTLSGVPSSALVLVDGTPFAVTSVLVPANATYPIGSTLEFRVRVNKTAFVTLGTGVPRIPVVVDSGGARFAEYVSGTGSTELTFSFAVTVGQVDATGIALGAAIELNGSQIRDIPGNPLTLALNGVPPTTGIRIDGARPEVMAINRADGSPTAQKQVTYTVVFTEPVTGVDPSDFTLAKTSTAAGSIDSVSQTGPGAYEVKVGSVGGDGTLTLTLNSSGTAIADDVGNPLIAGFSGQAYVVDNTAPTIALGAPSVPDASSGPVLFSVTYGGADTVSLAATDISLEATGTAAGAVSIAIVDAATWTISLSGITGAGTLAIRVAPGSAADLAGNKAPGAGPSAAVAVNQPPLVAATIPAQTRVYRAPFTFAVPAGTFADPNAEQSLTLSASGLPQGVLFDAATRSFSGSAPTGSHSITVIATDSGTPARSVSTSFSLTVTKAVLTVTADSKARPYGAANPALTSTITGFVGGETLATSGVAGAAQVTTAAVPQTPVGTAPISASLGSLTATNYSFVFAPGVLTIEKVPLTVIAENKTRTYNTINPQLTARFEGFVNGETSVVLQGSPSLATEAGAVTNVGVYPIVVGIGSLASPNYLFQTFTNGTLTITPAPVQIVLSDLFRVYNGQPQVVTASTTPAGNRVNLTYNGSAIPPVSAGAYAVVATSGDANFSGTASATLAIAKAPQTITFNPGTATPGVAIPLVATATSGLPVTFSVVRGNATIAENSLTLNDGTPVTVRATQSGGVNHEAALVERVIAATSLLSQSITANALANRPADSPPFAVSAAASSGLPVTVSMLSGPATVVGTTVTLTGQPGIVVLRVSQPGNATYAAATPVDLTFTVTPVGNDRIVNVSSRARIAAADRVLITGFVIGGNAPKQVLVRGIGPALAQFGLPDVLAAPDLRIFRGSDVIAENRGWSSGTDTAALTAAFARVGAFPLTVGAADSAVLVTLPPGAYTTHLSGGTGVALAEIYDASANPLLESQRLINVSIRSEAGSGDGALIAGFVIAGSTPKRVLIRGIGPSLVPFGVADALADTRLQVVGSAQTVVGENDN